MRITVPIEVEDQRVTDLITSVRRNHLRLRGPMESLLGIVIFYHRVQETRYNYHTHNWDKVKGSWYEAASPFAVERDGKPLRLLSNETSRSVWTDEEIVVKVDRTIPQADGEAHVWLQLEPEDRQYFATMLEVGEGYVVQEYVPLVKGAEACVQASNEFDDYDSMRDFVEELFIKYAMLWDFHDGQYGVDKRTGLVCVHDYCDGDSMVVPAHRFTTLRIGRKAA